VSLSPSASVPPGWYPDPGGQRQWRVWTGTAWSELTRPYGEPVVSAPVVTSLTLIEALHRLLRYGVVAFFAGLGLVVNILAHWPGTARPVAFWFANTALDTGIALLAVGSVCFSFAVRELEGHWTLEAFVPGINVLVAGALVTQRLAGRSPMWRVITETVLLALFIGQSHTDPWLGVAPALVALDHMRWTSALVERLAGPARSTVRALSQ
jgi:Protein of unknown function (DUF2510)